MKQASMELTYTRCGDVLFPDLCLSEGPEAIGKYGLLRKDYLKEHKRGWYSSLLLTGKLDAHLAEIDRACNERVELITNQLAKREGVTEALKAKKSDGMGQTDERYSRKSRRGYSNRADLLLI